MGGRCPTVLVANRNAGRFDPSLVERVSGLLGHHGDVDVVETDDPAQLDPIIATLGDASLVVAGGDGTVHHAVVALDRAGRADTHPLGVIPLGSGNDLVLGLGSSGDPLEVAARWGVSTARPLDLVVGDDTVVNAVGMGLGVRASAWSRPLKKHLPGSIAYRLGAVAAATATGSWQLQVHADGHHVAPAKAGAMLSVVVANGSTFGGGTPAIPPARPDDGLLDVLVSCASGPLARIGYGRALQNGTHLTRPDVTHVQCREVIITGRPVATNVDGEAPRPRRPRHRFRVLPAAWQIRLPDPDPPRRRSHQ